jgi:hypothetical protein
MYWSASSLESFYKSEKVTLRLDLRGDLEVDSLAFSFEFYALVILLEQSNLEGIGLLRAAIISLLGVSSR